MQGPHHRPRRNAIPVWLLPVRRQIPEHVSMGSSPGDIHDERPEGQTKPKLVHRGKGVPLDPGNLVRAAVDPELDFACGLAVNTVLVARTPLAERAGIRQGDRGARSALLPDIILREHLHRRPPHAPVHTAGFRSLQAAHGVLFPSRSPRSQGRAARLQQDAGYGGRISSGLLQNIVRPGVMYAASGGMGEDHLGGRSADGPGGAVGG
mmetsp:Transcript_15735/g.44797  ORF Transcript_15735/g.44797 Transcript_15735/m.44797 type:complete len:208 (+) Transcript_15735:252-875(+)